MFKRRTVLSNLLSSATSSFILLSCFVSSSPASEAFRLSQSNSCDSNQSPERWSSGTVLRISAPQDGHTRTIYAVAVSSDSRFVASGSVDRYIKIWDVENRSLYRTYRGSNQIKTLDFSPDGRILASGSVDGNIALWDLSSSSQEPIQLLTNHASSSVSAITTLAFHPNDDILATSGSDGMIRIWDTRSNQLIEEFEDDQNVFALAFSPDGEKLASGGSGGIVNIRNWSTGRVMESLNPGGGSVLSITFDAIDSNVLAIGTELLFESEDMSHGAEIWELENAEFLGFEGTQGGDIFSVEFSPDGCVFASASMDGSIKLWNLRDGSLIYDLDEHLGRVRDLEFSPDGRYLVSGGADTIVRIWIKN